MALLALTTSVPYSSLVLTQSSLPPDNGPNVVVVMQNVPLYDGKRFGISPFSKISPLIKS